MHFLLLTTLLFLSGTFAYVLFEVNVCFVLAGRAEFGRFRFGGAELGAVE